MPDRPLAQALESDAVGVRHSPAPITPYPFVLRVPAGIYFLELNVDPIADKPGGLIRRGITIAPHSRQFVFEMVGAKPK